MTRIIMTLHYCKKRIYFPWTKKKSAFSLFNFKLWAFWEFKNHKNKLISDYLREIPRKTDNVIDFENPYISFKLNLIALWIWMIFFCLVPRFKCICIYMMFITDAFSFVCTLFMASSYLDGYVIFEGIVKKINVHICFVGFFEREYKSYSFFFKYK